MSDKNKPQDDLSIEEILGSIRRIIAEDEDEEPVAAPGEAVVTEDIEDEEPLELTNKIEADGTIVDVAAEEQADLQPVADLSTQPIVEEIGFVDHVPDENDTEKNTLVEEPEPMALQDDDSVTPDTLLSSSTAEATSAVMAKLARHTALMEDGSGGGATIEGMVREILRPLLKSWLDENLAGIVQKMVEREIERLTKHL